MKFSLRRWMRHHLLRTDKDLIKWSKRLESPMEQQHREDHQWQERVVKCRICGRSMWTRWTPTTVGSSGTRSAPPSTRSSHLFPRTCLNSSQKWQTSTFCLLWYCKSFRPSPLQEASLLFYYLYSLSSLYLQLRIYLKISKDIEQMIKRIIGKP